MNIHKIITQKLVRELKEMGHEVWSYFSSPTARLRLKNGKYYYPDIKDETDKIVFEVHWKGGKKSEEYKNLPDGWCGVNVFIDEENNPATLVVKKNSLSIVKIQWEQEKIKIK